MPFKPKALASATALIAAAGLSACATQMQPSLSPDQIASIEVTTGDQLEFIPLNPARGDASPQAGVLWGDIREDVPSGVLLRFADGFSSPPHIHNITYRAVVIDGAIHNDDPDAAKMWMGPGSFWTQPAGEIHITAGQPGASATAFLEILEGPYLVQPGEKAFDNGEQPLNLTQANMVWLGPDEMTWIKTGGDASPSIAQLWEAPDAGALSGSLYKVPAGFSGQFKAEGASFRAVVVDGALSHGVTGATETVTLERGAYFASDAGVSHDVVCDADVQCLVYVRSTGRVEITG